MCELERVGELSRENGVGKRGPKGGDRMTWASPKRPWGSGGGGVLTAVLCGYKALCV